MDNAIAAELIKTVGAALALTIAGKPYAEVIAHLGAMQEHHRAFLMSGETMSTLDAASPLFSEIHFKLDRPGTSPEARILTLEFISKPGSYTFHDVRDAFGVWHRSPPEPDDASFSLAWFPPYDARSGAPFSLYAEFAPYSTAIDPAQTPARIFFQQPDGRWD